MAKKFRHFLSLAGPAGRLSWCQLITKRSKKRTEQHKSGGFLHGGEKACQRSFMSRSRSVMWMNNRPNAFRVRFTYSKALWENNVFTTLFKAILIVHKCWMHRRISLSWKDTSSFLSIKMAWNGLGLTLCQGYNLKLNRDHKDVHVILQTRQVLLLLVLPMDIYTVHPSIFC